MFRRLNLAPPCPHSRSRVPNVMTRFKALPFLQWRFFFSARAAKLFCVSCYSTKIYPTLTTGVKRLQERQKTTMKADFFSKATKSRSFDFLLGWTLFKHRSRRNGCDNSFNAQRNYHTWTKQQNSKLNYNRLNRSWFVPQGLLRCLFF